MTRIPESGGSLLTNTTNEIKAIALTTVAGTVFGASFSLFKMKGWKSGALMGTYLGLVISTIDLLSSKAFDVLECYNSEREKRFTKGIADASTAWLAIRIVSKKYGGKLDHVLAAFFLLYFVKKGALSALNG